MTRFTVFVLAALLVACADEPEQTPVISTPVATEMPEAVRTAVIQHSQTACDAADSLHAAVSAFLDAPAADTLVAARSQWEESHGAWSRLLVPWQLAHMTPPQIQQGRDPIDAHPILPGYLDRVPGYPRSGIVYSEVPLTPAFLQQEHQSTDFLYGTLGFHPLETLLWGGIDQRPENRSQLFLAPDTLPREQFDSRTRRIELLRIMAHALPRDVALVCVHSNRLTLTHALSEIRKKPEAARATLSDALDVLVDQRLAEWERNPDGTDRNGMPLGHSMFARTDFEIMATQVEDLHRLWLGLLLPDAERDEEALAALTERSAALAARLRAHHASPASIIPGEISSTRTMITRLRSDLETLQAGAPESEEAGQ